MPTLAPINSGFLLVVAVLLMVSATVNAIAIDSPAGLDLQANSSHFPASSQQADLELKTSMGNGCRPGHKCWCYRTDVCCGCEAIFSGLRQIQNKRRELGDAGLNKFWCCMLRKCGISPRLADSRAPFRSNVWGHRSSEEMCRRFTSGTPASRPSPGKGRRASRPSPGKGRASRPSQPASSCTCSSPRCKKCRRNGCTCKKWYREQDEAEEEQELLDEEDTASNTAGGRAEAAWAEGVELGDAVAGKARARQGWSPATPTPTQTLNLATAIDDDSCMM